MHSNAPTESKMCPEELAAYWQGLSRRHLPTSRDGLEVICFAGMPDWFNRFMHRYQMKAFERLLRDERFDGRDVLDIGTGVGRWARWFARWRGARVTGIDLDPIRIERARALGRARYEVMSADELAFADGSFDVVNSVTVLQHVDHDTKARSLNEIARVLRPGGRFVLFEITDMSDDAPHVFPWPERRWIAAAAASGFRLERVVGDQYVPLLRLAKSLMRRTSRTHSRDLVDALKVGRRTPTDRAGLAVLRAAIGASYPIEEVARFLPARFGRISGLLFVKSVKVPAR